MATATCTAFRGVLESSGERVGQALLSERVGFPAQLSRELTGALVASRWDEESLEARGHRRGNARLSGQVRGTVAEAIRHLAAKAGVAVVTVPARGSGGCR